MCNINKLISLCSLYKHKKIKLIQIVIKKNIYKKPLGLSLAISMIHKEYGCIENLFNQYNTRRKTMKKLLVSIFVIGVLVAGYAMPVLASGGGGPW